MANPVAIQIALANLSGRVSSEVIYNFIESASDNIETYELDSTKVSAAAIEYVVLLSVAGSIASLATLLWMVYDKFIAPTKRSSSDEAGIYVVLRRPDGNLVEFLSERTTKIAISSLKTSKPQSQNYATPVITCRNTKKSFSRSSEPGFGLNASELTNST